MDTDIAGVMHFSNFLRYFEACEQEFFRSIGLTWNEIREKYNILLPRVEAHCEYKAACTFDDLIDVTLKVREVANKTIAYDLQIYRKSDNQLAAEGFMKCIAVDKNWKAVPLPAEIANILRENMKECPSSSV